ncbi:MAG TPA: hypothetical protein VNI79_05275 [Sphingomicrobium sp.]|nr:hypothetical protein [Sphingomicrobium sp.]
MTTIASAALTLAIIAAAILTIGGARLFRRDRQRAFLMIAAAIVLIGNVLIWTL